MLTLRSTAFVLAAIALVPTTLVADDEAEYQKIADAHSNTLVSVKFVLKMKMGGMFGGGDNESEQEVTAVMIDAKGLILCSNTQLGGFMGMMGRMSSMFGEMTATPTDIKVLIGDDNEGVEAELLARDSEFDLAWIQIKKPADTPYKHVDLSKAGKPKLGQRIFALNRMGKYFGRAITVSSGRIIGVCKKPRDLYIPGEGGGGALGLPVFTATGDVLGITVLQLPDAEGDGDNPMSMFSSLGNLQSMAGGAILPAEEVMKATARARERAKEESSDAGAEKADEGKADEKKSGE